MISIQSLDESPIEFLGVGHALILDVLVVDVLGLGVDVVLEVVALALELGQLALVGVVDRELIVHLVLLLRDVDLVVRVRNCWADLVLYLVQGLLVLEQLLLLLVE